MPGMGLLMEGAMQQAAQWGRHSMAGLFHVKRGDAVLENQSGGRACRNGRQPLKSRV
jgi:hypothetical protein